MKWTGKTTAKLALAVGKFRSLLPGLRSNGGTVHCYLYVRLHYTLAPGALYGYAEVRAVRANGDATAYQGVMLPAPAPGKPGGSFNIPIPAHWMGANPETLTWQIRPMQGVKSAHVTTRYAKTEEI